MKVIQINAVNGIRSTGRIVLDISEFLNRSDKKGFIVYSDGLPYNKGFKIGNIFEKKSHAFFSRLFGLQGYFSRYGTRKLIKFLNNEKPDVVHLHNLHANYINLKLLFNYLSNNDIPTVITLHDCWFYTGKCSHYTLEGCYKWLNQCYKCPRLRKDNPSWFFDRTTKMYNDKKRWIQNIPRLAVIGVSDWITEEAQKSFLSSSKIIRRIYNWIDLDIFKPVDTSILRRKMNLENKFVILGVSSGWSKAKGLDKFIKLSSSISDDMIIILVGNIKSNVKLPKNIIHINETHDVYELVNYYSLADVFLNLSLEETFGKVTAEALACGTPAIVLNSTANPELIGNNCGFVVDNFDIDILKNYLNFIKTKGKHYFSNDCITFARENFKKEDRLNDYINLYKKIMLEDGE